MPRTEQMTAQMKAAFELASSMKGAEPIEKGGLSHILKSLEVVLWVLFF